MDGSYDDPHGTIFNAWWFALAEGVFDEVWGISNQFIVGNLIDRMFKGPDAGLPLAYDYLEGATPTEAVTGALVAALDGLTADYGTADMSAWMQPISVIHWAPMPLTPAVPDTIWMNRGTYNQIVHLRGNVTARNVISPGQSGDPASPHFADQLALYANWAYKPMRLSKADLKGFIESTTVLHLP
jgi:acyl-homoserine lactone acylase PvdQ